MKVGGDDVAFPLVRRSRIPLMRADSRVGILCGSDIPLSADGCLMPQEGELVSYRPPERSDARHFAGLSPG